MKVGVVFPQVEIGLDPQAIKDYAQAVESLGYTHILAFDHVLGANPDRPGGWTGPYTYRHTFHEPWRGMSGVTHLCVHTVGLGLKTPAEHVKMLEQFREEALR
jgi:hypothetical protein